MCRVVGERAPHWREPAPSIGSSFLKTFPPLVAHDMAGMEAKGEIPSRVLLRTGDSAFCGVMVSLLDRVCVSAGREAWDCWDGGNCWDGWPAGACWLPICGDGEAN